MFSARRPSRAGGLHLRLATLYGLLFAGSVLLLAGMVYFGAHQALEVQFRARVEAESDALRSAYAAGGVDALVRLVRSRESAPAALDYRVEDPDGDLIAGDLPPPDRRQGWARLVEPADAEDDAESILALVTPLDGRGRMVVGDDLARIEEADEALLRAFAIAVVGVIALGGLGGWGLSRGFLRHVEAITTTAEAIIDGDLTRRVPRQGAHGDLDHLAATLNRMLDRIQLLMTSLRQVSDDIAHDLRTPLTRLRNRLEAALAEARDVATYEEAVRQAVADTDAILETFSALLRIAQVEAGARRSAFRPVDLSEVAATVAEAFAPSAEEAGRTLALVAPTPVWVLGDRELLTQMLVNLVENALRHTPPGSKVTVSTDAREGACSLAVTDNGPGIPAEDRDAVLRRFVRLEQSRTTPGSGLGLSLADAIVRLHGGRLVLEDARPGLIVRAVFAAAPRAEVSA